MGWGMEREMNRNRVLMPVAAVAFAGAMVVVVPAFANGGDFFQELAESLAYDKNPDEGPFYFGFVRDVNGRVVPNATVSATIRPSGSSMMVHADILGHYRISGISKRIDPKNVDITCGKEGFRQVTRNRRVQRTADGPIEVTCTLAPLVSQL